MSALAARRALIKRSGGKGLGIFSITPIGIALVVVGMVYMQLTRWLLPRRSGAHGDDDYLRLDRYRTELLVVEGSRWSTRPLAELQKALGDRFRLRGWLRDGKPRDDLTAGSPLLVGDVLLVEASADDLMSLHDDPGLDLNAIARFGDTLTGEGEPQLVQAVVAPGSEFIGRSIRALDFSHQFQSVIVGLWRRSGEIGDRLGDARLQEGDLLVLYGHPSHFSDLAAHHGFLMLVPFAGEGKRRLRAPLALVILGLTILAAATEWLPASLAFLLGAVAMVATRCVDIEQAYRQIDVRIFVMIAGVIPLGIAMEQTGTARLLAHGLLPLVAHLSPLGVLLLVFTMAALLTQVMSDAATTVLLAPIAVSLASSIGLPPTPFVVCTALGAVVAFLTPDRASRQPADPRAGAIPLCRFPAGRAAADGADCAGECVDGAVVVVGREAVAGDWRVTTRACEELLARCGKCTCRNPNSFSPRVCGEKVPILKTSWQMRGAFALAPLMLPFNQTLSPMASHFSLKGRKEK